MISASDDFLSNDFPEFDKQFLKQIRDSSVKVKRYINNFSNPYLKSNLITDYEAVSQYEIFKMINYNRNDFEKNLDKISLNTYKNLIFKYPLEFLGLTFHHYVTMCTPGGRIFLLEKLSKELNLEIPHIKLFKNLSGNIEVDKLNKSLILITYFTFIFMIFYFLLALFSFLKLLLKIRIN